MKLLSSVCFQTLNGGFEDLTEDLQLTTTQISGGLTALSIRTTAAESRLSTLQATSVTLVDSVGGLLSFTAATGVTVDQLVLASASHSRRLDNLEVDSVAALNRTAGLQQASNQTIGLTRYLKEQVDHIYVLLEGLFFNDTETDTTLANLSTRMVWSESNYTSLTNKTTVMNNLLLPVAQNLTVTSALAVAADLLSVDSALRVSNLEAQSSYSDRRYAQLAAVVLRMCMICCPFECACFA
jgi:hypothetical protein